MIHKYNNHIDYLYYRRYLFQAIRHPYEYIKYLWFKYKLGQNKDIRRWSTWEIDTQTRKDIITGN